MMSRVRPRGGPRRWKRFTSMISLNMAMTLDGKVARPDGRWHGISSPRDRARMDEIRGEHQAIIAGKNSVLNDDPNLLPAGENPPLPILLARGSLYPLDRRVFNQSRVPPLVLINRTLRENPRWESADTGGNGDPSDSVDYFRRLENVADVLWLEHADFHPERLFALLGNRGLDRILLETGPVFNYPVVQKDLLDVLYLTLTPFLFGQPDLPGIVDGPGPLPGFDRKLWRLERAEPIEEEVFLKYRRQR